MVNNQFTISYNGCQIPAPSNLIYSDTDKPLKNNYCPVANIPAHSNHKTCRQPTLCGRSLSPVQAKQTVGLSEPISRQSIDVTSPFKNTDSISDVPMRVDEQQQSDQAPKYNPSKESFSIESLLGNGSNMRREKTTPSSLQVFEKYTSKYLMDSPQLKSSNSGVTTKHQLECKYYLECNKKFLTQSGLNRHIKSFHERVINFNCNECGKGIEGSEESWPEEVDALTVAVQLTVSLL